MYVPHSVHDPTTSSHAVNSPLLPSITSGSNLPLSQCFFTMDSLPVSQMTPRPLLLCCFFWTSRFLPHHTVVWRGTYFTVCNFFCLCLCMVTDFSAAEKARGVKFCTHVGLLSGQVFSPFGEHWLAGSHGGGGITSRMNAPMKSYSQEMCVPGNKYWSQRWRSMATGHSELRVAALLKDVWWGMRLASPLTHWMFLTHYSYFVYWFHAAD